MSGRHSPRSRDSYLSAHNGRLADFADHFVERDTLAIETTAVMVAWLGVLYRRDGIRATTRSTAHSGATTQLSSPGGVPIVTRCLCCQIRIRWTLSSRDAPIINGTSPR